MRLDLPFDTLLGDDATVLIAGMGGGFDVFCGLPIYFELRRRGHTAHLASVSFASLHDYSDAEWLSPTLVGVGPAATEARGYHPERFLARWFRDVRGEDVVIWCFDSAGAQPLRDDFRLLVRRLGIDAIVLIDGGVDSLTRGDEVLVGTVLEDYVTLAAASLLHEVPVRVVACLAMGVEGDVSHAGVLQNIAEITRNGGFLGTSALLAQTDAYRLYDAALVYVHAQPGQQPSVVNTSVISSAQGRFGDYHATTRTHGSELWISPLMSLYWFFAVDAVAAQNLFMRELQATTTIEDAAAAIYDTREQMTLRPAAPIRLA